MIEISETFDCKYIECGRKFKTKEELLSHYERRHEKLIPLSSNTKESQIIEIDENNIEIKIKIITEEMIGIGTKYADIDEIEEVRIFLKRLN